MKSALRISLLTLMLVFFPQLAMGVEKELALTRAVAAKEQAFDHPDPAKWQEAFDRFLEADTLDPSADTKYELAFIAVQLNQGDLAVSYYEDAIALGLSGSALEKGRSFLNKKTTTIARLMLRGKNGFHVQIRGIDRGTLPLEKPLVVYAGTTEFVIVDASGRRVAQRTVYVPTGQTEHVDLDPVPQVISKTVALEFPRPESIDTLPHVSTPSVGAWLLGTGSGLLLASALSVPLTSLKISSKRDQLADACDVPARNPDGCPVTKRGRYDEAIELANDIARWKTVRTVAWVGIGVGFSSAALGLLLVTKANRTPRTKRVVAIWPTTEPNLAALNCRVEF
jgi:hypothetical protein